MEICRDYSLEKYSYASTVVENVKKKLSKDREFGNRVNELSKKLINSQPESWPVDIYLPILRIVAACA